MRSILSAVEKSLRSEPHDGEPVVPALSDSIPASTIDPVLHRAEIDAALQSVTSHALMRKSPKLKAFLSFAVNETLAGRGDRLKAYSIAVAALGKSAAFDPVTDPIVRVEASRLRRFLKIYYAADGKADPIRISMPTGSYQPIFERLRNANDLHVLKQDSIVTAPQNQLDSDPIPISYDPELVKPRVPLKLAHIFTPRVQRAMLIANTIMMIFTILVGIKILVDIEDIVTHMERVEKNWNRHLTAQVD